MNGRVSKATDHLQRDPVMAGLMERVGVIRHRARQLPPYESLVHAIIHQQLSGKAAATIFGRFQERVGRGGRPSPEAVLRASPDLLREVGLSRPKVAYIRGLAEKALAGEIPSLDQCAALSDGEIIARLTTIKGIGRWTVEMLLIFNLGRPDVLPVNDLGIRRGFQISHGKRTLPEPRRLARHGERWKPFRTLAALYLWRGADG